MNRLTYVERVINDVFIVHLLAGINALKYEDYEAYYIRQYEGDSTSTIVLSREELANLRDTVTNEHWTEEFTNILKDYPCSSYTPTAQNAV